MKVLVLGSKEYPMGSNKGEDPQPSGGIEVYIDQLIKRLGGETNLKFVIITRKFKNTPGYEGHDGIEIHRVRWIQGFYFRNISFNLSSFLKALRLDFEVVFSQDLFATFFGVFLSKIKKKSLISVVHGTASNQPQYPGVLRRILRWLEVFSYARADLLIAFSGGLVRNFKEALSGKVGWKIIPFGVDLERFEGIDREDVRKRLDLEPDKMVISFVGRLLEVKGLEHLLEALSKIKQDFTVLIVGSGPDESKLRRYAEKLGLEGKVRFLGFRDDVPDILVASDIYVLPSLSEGLSISLLEAKAAGCACVVSDIGLPVTDGVNALVVDPGDLEDLYSALMRLIDDEKLRKRLSENAKQDAYENYQWKDIIKEYSKVFK